MKNTLETEESTLKRLLYHFRLVPYYSTGDLRKEMRQFMAFIKKPECLRLTDEEKIKAFRIERAGVSNDSKDVNFPAAAAWAYLISIGRKSFKGLTSERRQLTILDYERVKREGIWEEDPPELKEYFDKYQIYLKEAKKWDMPIPTATLKRWFKLTENKEFEKYYDELAKKIASWMERHPPATLAEMIRPNQNRQDMLKWFAEKPVEEGGLGIPYPDKYPFGIYFLTLNIIAQLYGLNSEIMDVILTKISKIYKEAKRRQPANERAEMLDGHVKTYEKVIAYISSTSAREIENLESYINASLAYWFRREKWRTRGSKEEIPLTDLSQEEDSETHQRKLDHIISQSIYFQEYSHYPDEKILAEEREKELKCVRLDFKKEFRSLSLRQKNLAFLETLGTLTQEEEAKKLGCNVRTIKRDLKELRSNPRLQRLYKEDKDLRSE